MSSGWVRMCPTSSRYRHLKMWQQWPKQFWCHLHTLTTVWSNCRRQKLDWMMNIFKHSAAVMAVLLAPQWDQRLAVYSLFHIVWANSLWPVFLHTLNANLQRTTHSIQVMTGWENRLLGVSSFWDAHFTAYFWHSQLHGAWPSVWRWCEGKQGHVLVLRETNLKLAYRMSSLHIRQT